MQVTRSTMPVAVASLGALVMPYNIYFQSAIVNARPRDGDTEEKKSLLLKVSESKQPAHINPDRPPSTQQHVTHITHVYKKCPPIEPVQWFVHLSGSEGHAQLCCQHHCHSRLGLRFAGRGRHPPGGDGT
jgi:hypothetical protein